MLGGAIRCTEMYKVSSILMILFLEKTSPQLYKQRILMEPM